MFILNCFYILKTIDNFVIFYIYFPNFRKNCNYRMGIYKPICLNLSYHREPKTLRSMQGASKLIIPL